MKVLYLGGVGPFGGASRSLYEAVGAFPESAVDAYFLMPRGTAFDFYRRVARDVIATRGISRFDHSRATHYRGLRWLVLLRELFHIPFTLAGLLRARRRWPDIDLIHVNEFFEIIPGLVARRLFKAPLVVHVRSLVETDRRLWRTRWLHRMLRKAHAVVAIDESVRASLPDDLAVDVIHNSFTAKASEVPDEAYLAQLDALRSGSLKVGFVGNLLGIKGVTELIEGVALAREHGADVQLLAVGGAIAPERGLVRRLLKRVGLAQNVSESAAAMIEARGLGDAIVLLGPTADIQRVYPAFDVLAFPSHFDAPGRPVFEAAFFGVPSIVAVAHPKPDTVVDGEAAFAIAAPDPRLIAEAILKADADRPALARMGEAARALAKRNFDPKTNAAALLALYRRVLAGALR